MNERADLQAIERLRSRQRGVFTIADLRVALSEPHRAALYRRIDRLIEGEVLQRFANGVYVAEGFDLFVLSQRLAPDSAISFEAVLARELVIGPRPVNVVSAIRGGRPMVFDAHGRRIEYHRLHAGLRFGERSVDGVRMTDPEKAILDVLTFHLRGRRALFDLRSDVAIERLDLSKIEDYLARYRNPRFVAFARSTLRIG